MAAPVATVTAFHPFQAVGDVAGNDIHMPAQGTAAAFQDHVASAGCGPARAHVESLAHSVQGLGETSAGEQREACQLVPFCAGVRWQREARRVVDDRAPSQAASGQDGHGAASGHEQSAVEVERAQHLALHLRHGLRLRIVTLLQHHDAPPALCQDSGGHSAACSRSDHDNVAVESGVAVHG